MRGGHRVEPGSESRGRLRFRERPGNGERSRERVRWHEGTVSVSAARPLLRPAPRSAMFFPLVVIVAVLPGLSALSHWDLTPPGPWWGLRALAVLDGHVLDQMPAARAIGPGLESATFRAVASQPPLYAWLEALGFALSPSRNPLAGVLPSYAAGAAVVVLVYLHGRLWRGPGVGLVAAVLVGFDRNLLVQMQQAAPTTLALAGVLATLFCYGRHQRVMAGSAEGDPLGRGGPVAWAVLGGVGLGVSLLSVGLFGLAAVPVVLLHQAYLTGGPRVRSGPERRWWADWLGAPGVHAGLVAIAVALALAAPWYVWAIHRHGHEILDALRSPLDLVVGPRPGLLARMIQLAPATLPLGLFAAVRSVRRALADDSEDRATVGGAFWVLWLAVAALTRAVWPTGPWHLGGLFLLVPLNLLAAQAICDLATRRIPVRTLIWLAPATAVTVAWSASAELRGAVGDLIHGRADSATGLGVHLALDLLVIAVWLTRRLDGWARRRDDRQRRVLAGFLLAVLAVTAGLGVNEVLFRHSETVDLLMLRTMILRRDRERPFTLVAVVGPEAFRQTSEGPLPGGRLRFILRSALPRLPQLDLTATDDLLTLPPNGQRLVILAGREQRLPYSVQSRLGLEAIHPGRMGVFDAFATASAVEGGRGRRRD